MTESSTPFDRIRARVETDPEVRGGEPVIRGTRTPEYGIARKLELGATPADLLADHPHLSQEDLDIAVLYARLCPKPDRPLAEFARGLRRRRSAEE